MHLLHHNRNHAVNSVNKKYKQLSSHILSTKIQCRSNQKVEKQETQYSRECYYLMRPTRGNLATDLFKNDSHVQNKHVKINVF